MKNIITTLGGLLILVTGSLNLPAAVNVRVNPDGTRYSAVLVNGSSAVKYDIVFVGDGFTSSTADQTAFNNAVDTAVQAMRNEPPYSQNMCAFNIWRVNVISAESGIDHPLNGISKNTELNCTFGNNVSVPERVIRSTTPARVTEAANFAPAHDAIYVLANDPQYGGASGDIVYTSLNSSMGQVIVHELGHFVGRLADEYTCYFCDGRLEPVYQGPEPPQVNVTIQTDRNLIKWRNFIDPSTPLPTTVNSPPGVVGLWEGGLYSPTRVFRPQQDCLMRELDLDLCAVCNDSLSNILWPFCDPCQKDPLGRACLISRLRDHLMLYRYPIRLKIPDCCFCPLKFEPRTVEIVLTLDPKEFETKVSDGRRDVRASISENERGITRISFTEVANTSYSLVITPRGEKAKASNVTVKMTRNGKSAALF